MPGDEGMEALANALSEPECKLTWIHVGGNAHGPAGATAMAKAAETNAALTVEGLDPSLLTES